VILLEEGFEGGHLEARLLIDEFVGPHESVTNNEEEDSLFNLIINDIPFIFVII
jgi:hypothetical protein